MSTNTVRVGLGIRPGDPFWVQVRESVRQRAQELDITLVPMALPEFTQAGDSIIDTIEELKAQEFGAQISWGVKPQLICAPEQPANDCN